MKYRVIETSDVTSESIEEILNDWTEKGWRLDGIQFVTKESARRPSMAFILFIQSSQDEANEPD